MCVNGARSDTPRLIGYSIPDLNPSRPSRPVDAQGSRLGPRTDDLLSRRRAPSRQRQRVWNDHPPSRRRGGRISCKTRSSVAPSLISLRACPRCSPGVPRHEGRRHRGAIDRTIPGAPVSVDAAGWVRVSILAMPTSLSATSKSIGRWPCRMGWRRRCSPPSATSPTVRPAPTT